MPARGADHGGRGGAPGVPAFASTWAGQTRGAAESGRRGTALLGAAAAPPAQTSRRGCWAEALGSPGARGHAGGPRRALRGRGARSHGTRACWGGGVPERAVTRAAVGAQAGRQPPGVPSSGALRAVTAAALRLSTQRVAPAPPPCEAPQPRPAPRVGLGLGPQRRRPAQPLSRTRCGRPDPRTVPGVRAASRRSRPQGAEAFAAVGGVTPSGTPALRHHCSHPSERAPAAWIRWIADLNVRGEAPGL